MKGDYTALAEMHEDEMTLKESRFIGIALPCAAEEDIKKNLTDTEKKYPNATHYCYAAVYAGSDRRERSSDNGEPSGTAAKPMMAVLKGSGLSDTMVIAVRYFGGTLLGTGGLVHAYTESASIALKGAATKVCTSCAVYSFQLDYTTYNRFETKMGDLMARRPECGYSDRVDVRAWIRTEDEDEFLRRLSDLTERKVIPFRAGSEYI